MADFKDIYAKEAHTSLIHQMRSGAYANSAHLPRESELAKMMGISRTQMRDILAVLECEGFITRRHGVGTLINRHVLQVPARIDMEQEFLDIIHAGGYKPGVASAEEGRTVADETLAKALGVTQGAELVHLKKLVTADKKPAIFCEDLFDAALLQAPLMPRDVKGSVFRLLQDKCSVNCYMDISELHPIVADEALSRILEIPQGAPLLRIDEVDYDIEGKPVLYSRQYFVNDYFHHHILRKRL